MPIANTVSMVDDGDLTHCIHCGVWINPEYGADAPGTNQGHAGTKSDPRAPGDFDNICDDCQYGKGLRGYPKPIGEARGGQWKYKR